MTTITEQNEIYNYSGGDLLLDLLANILGYRLELTNEPNTASLRFTAYTSHNRLILHIVNYAVPVTLPKKEEKKAEPIPVPGFTINVRSPQKGSLSLVRMLSPDFDAKEIKWSIHSNIDF
ncbi:MAG: hypothetical protein QXT06_07655 [Candidatus Bathyarchaeia archaeon]